MQSPEYRGPGCNAARERFAERAELRLLANDRGRIVGDTSVSVAPKTVVPEAAEPRMPGTTPPGAAFSTAAAQHNETRAITYQEGGKTYTGTVPAYVSDSIAVPALKQHIEHEKRVGPEKNPLILAVDKGDAGAVKRLIASGYDVREVVDREGRPTGIVARAVFRWYRDGNKYKTLDQQEKEAAAFVAITKQLVEAGADVSGTFGGATALAQIAAGSWKQADPSAAPELAAYLLQHGAILTIPEDTSNYSALDSVTGRGAEQLLVDCNA
jgi:hypothetical protein